jgi:hypothetical protein
MAGRIRGHVTIEKTGKGLKFQSILAWLTLLFGVGLCVAGYSERADGGLTETAVNGYWTIGSAVAWMVILRMLRWWHHD